MRKEDVPLCADSPFTLFCSHLDLAHQYWERLLDPDDWAIDATCGNGHDTLKLVQILAQGNGGVIGLDVQELAIASTRARLQNCLPVETAVKAHLFVQSHCSFPPIASTVEVKLIVYNLGYLPRGNKELTTLTHTTLQSVQKGLDLISPGGALFLTCYPGHPEGAREEGALLELAQKLPPSLWNVCWHTFPNRHQSPSLLVIQKSSSISNCINNFKSFGKK